MGMLFIDETCPHCLKDNAILRCIAESRLANEIFSLVFECRSCSRIMIAEVETAVYGGPTKHAEHSVFPVCVNRNDQFSVISTYPSANKPNAPQYISPKSERFYIEAKDNFARGNYETSVMLIRKVLDISTREILGEDAKKETLNQRISILRVKDLITEQMKDWAHIVRIESNDAVHSDEEFSASEASELIDFTEVFLLYSFTLPTMVEAKKAANKN